MTATALNPARWAVSGAAAALLVGAAVLLFSRTTVSISPQQPRVAKPVIALGAAREDELAMRDLTPLFLPTPLNAAPSTATPAEPGRAFFDHDPGQHTLFAEENPQIEIPAVVAPPASAAAAVTMPPPPLSAGIGRSNLSVPALPAAGGRVDVYSVGGGPSLLGVNLPPEAAPAQGASSVPWQPAEFAVAIDTMGLVNSLVLTRSSGREEIDAHFRNFLASHFHLGDRLPSGFYRVVVAP